MIGLKSEPKRVKRRHESGQTLIMFTLGLGVLFGMVALSIDVGLILHERRQLQNAADAAALAGVQELPASPGAAVAAAQQYATANGVDLTDPAFTFAATTPYEGDAGKIEVKVSRQVGFLFGRVLGLSFVDVPARAVAKATPVPGGAASDASIIALNPTLCLALDIGANGAFTTEGSIMINSNCANYAAKVNANNTFKALGGVYVVGEVQFDVGGACTGCNPNHVAPFEDPLKDLLPPCFPSSPAPCQNVGPLTVRNGTPDNPQLLKDSSFDFQPGIYYGGIDISPNNPITFAPGIYIMAGGGFKVNSNSAFTAQGVFIYNTNDPDCPSCSDGGFKPVIINSNDAVNMSPMTDGPYAGLLFFQDRANTEKAVFNPNASFGEGTFYFPSALVDLNPNDFATLQIIADTVKINNNSAFTAKFDGDNFFQGEGKPTVRLTE